MIELNKRPQERQLFKDFVLCDEWSVQNMFGLLRRGQDVSLIADGFVLLCVFRVCSENELSLISN